MKEPANDKSARANGVGADAMRVLRHDIKNQLSNIFLALEQLRYEIPDDCADCKFYLDLISSSSEIINNLLKETE